MSFSWIYVCVAREVDVIIASCTRNWQLYCIDFSACQARQWHVMSWWNLKERVTFLSREMPQTDRQTKQISETRNKFQGWDKVVRTQIGSLRQSLRMWCDGIREDSRKSAGVINNKRAERPEIRSQKIQRDPPSTLSIYLPIYLSRGMDHGWGCFRRWSFEEENNAFAKAS